MLLYLELAFIILLFAIMPLYLFIKKYKNTNIVIEKKLMYFTLLISFFVFDLILFGAFTRLTDSGLGCPDWPGCFNNSNPFSANYHIVLAQTILPNGPVTIAKAWIEMVHRYFAGMVGFLIIILNILTYKYAKYINFKFYCTLAILIIIIIQGLFGALTVTMKLQPLIVTIHLTLAMILILSLIAFYTYQKKKIYNINCIKNRLALNYYKVGLVIFILLFIQVMLGAWVSSNYAILGCTEFPTCINKQYLPHSDFYHGFSIWRSLGKDKYGQHLSFQALTAIHLTHRLMAIFIFVSFITFLSYIFINLNKIISNELKHHFQKIILGLIFILFLQVCSGIASVLLPWRIIIVMFHTAGATLLLGGLIYILTILKPQKTNYTK